MNTFLSKISQLDSIQDVIFLSTQGEPLFFNQRITTAGNREKVFSYWNEIISDLDQPQTAEFIFTKGSYYLSRTAIGYVIIGLNDDKVLKKIKQACATILKKLSDPPHCKRVLLNLLPNSNDLLKANIIKALVPYADKEVAAVLIFLLQKEKGFATEAREELLLLICQTLGYCSSYDAVDSLQGFLSSHGTDSNALSSKITEAVRISVEQLGRDTPEKEKTTPGPPPKTQVQEDTKGARDRKKKAAPAETKTIAQKPLPKQQKIDALLGKGKKDEALALITQLIDNYAGKKQFETADRLRDWLIQINPMALLEIIHAAEVIENAKHAAINKDHLETWKELLEILSGEEFSSLYHAMTLKTYVNGKTIVQQGSNARTLLFVNSGRVQIQTLTQNRLLPLSVKEGGEIIGAGTFFEASVWTINAKSLGCELFLLSRAKFKYLKERFPALESKLSDFCSNFQSSSAQLRKTRKNRRQFERKDVSGRLVFAVLDNNGKEIIAEAKGNLIDISTGGVAFSIHSSKKKNAASLFGRQLRVNINTGMASNILVRQGKVQAVRDMDLIGNEYSLHLEFSKPLSISELQQIITSQR